MGTIIKAWEIDKISRMSRSMLVVYCNHDPAISDAAVALNVPMAKLLLAVKPGRRTMRMELCMQKALRELPDDVVIKDFDVLFHPDYEIDVLRILISLHRTKPFRVLWPGSYEDGKLSYAEEGFQDYKVYELADYDVACVI